MFVLPKPISSIGRAFVLMHKGCGFKSHIGYKKSVMATNNCNLNKEIPKTTYTLQQLLSNFTIQLLRRIVFQLSAKYIFPW